MNKLLAILLAFCALQTTWADSDGKTNPFQDPRFCMVFGKTFMEEKCCSAPPPKLFDGPELTLCKDYHPESQPAVQGTRRGRDGRDTKQDTSSLPTTCAIDCFFNHSLFYTADAKIDGDKIIAYFNTKTDVAEDIRNIFIAGVPKCLKGANAQCTAARKGLASCDPFYFPEAPKAGAAAADGSAVKHRAHKGSNGGRGGAGRKSGPRNGNKRNTQKP